MPVAQEPSTPSPIPHNVEASTQKSRSTSGSFFRTLEGHGDVKILDHHESKLRQDIGKLWRTWSFGNLDKKLERDTR